MAHGAVPDLHSDRWEVLLRTWYQGCYGDGHTWVLYRNRWDSADRFAARYLDDAEDGGTPKRRAKPAPDPDERRGRTTLLSPEAVRRLLAEGGIAIPLIGFEDSFGLDGDRRGLTMSAFGTSSSVSWWCEGPPEWEPLVAWVERLQRYLHAELFPGEPDVPRVLRP